MSELAATIKDWLIYIAEWAAFLAFLVVLTIIVSWLWDQIYKFLGV